METPLYLRRILLPEGAEAVTGSNARPRRCALPGAPFIAVVFNGRGRVLDWFAGETREAAIEPALAAYVEREAYWRRLGAAGKTRVARPPVWGAYQFVDGRYLRLADASMFASAGTEAAPPDLAGDSGTQAIDGPAPAASESQAVG